MTEAQSGSSSSPDPRGKPSPALIIFLIFPIIGIIAAILVAASSGSPTPSGFIPTPAPVTSEPVVNLLDQPATNFELNDLNGSPTRLSSYRGRLVFLNFWATWCEPCQRELPAFRDFMAEQGDGGAIVLAVNSGETSEQITAYFDQHGIDGVPVLLDIGLEVYDAYNVQVLPTTYVIDAGGVVRYRHLGEMTPDDLAGYMAELSQP